MGPCVATMTQVQSVTATFTQTTTVTSTPGGNTITPLGAANVALLAVNAGPVSGSPQANVAYTTVTVCAPTAPTNCVTIPNIAVDTGSTGLRIPYSLLSTLNLQNVNTAHPTAECIQFLDNSFFFGTVRSANVRMGGATGDGTGHNGEVASSIPILDGRPYHPNEQHTKNLSKITTLAVQR